MLALLKKLFKRKPPTEEHMVYSQLLNEAESRIRVYVIKSEPSKYRFEHKTDQGSTSFVTRRFLTDYLPAEELQTGMYDKLVSKKFNLEITFKPNHNQGTLRDSKQSNL